MSSTNDNTEVPLSPASQQHLDDLLNSFEEGELRDEITPPPSPPPISTPSPPPPTYSDILYLKARIDNIELQLGLLERSQPTDYVISFTGIHHLSQSAGPSWINKIHYLLRCAHIPPLWILRIIQTDNEHDPNCLDIYVVNHMVKMIVMHAINIYLRDNYEDDVYIL